MKQIAKLAAGASDDSSDATFELARDVLRVATLTKMKYRWVRPTLGCAVASVVFGIATLVAQLLPASQA